MQTALADLDLDQLWIVYPGKRTYVPREKISVLPLGKAISPT